MLPFFKPFFWRFYQYGDILTHIDHKKRYVFIHIPKNAGTSISKALNFDRPSHATIRQVRKVLDNYQFNNYFKFCFVRNPYDRFLSLYNYARMPESMYHSAINPEEALCGKHYDYDLLKNASLEDCANYLVEGKLQHEDNWFHWQPQYHWLVDDKGNIIVDFVGRFEYINRDFNSLKKKLDIDVCLPHINTSSDDGNSYERHYNSTTKRIVSEYYKKDFELFDYNF